jgi:hypothetical protein
MDNDYDMDLAGQSAARAAHVLPATVGDAACILMDADNGRVDHLAVASWALADAFMIRSQTPARRQRTKRL